MKRRQSKPNAGARAAALLATACLTAAGCTTALLRPGADERSLDELAAEETPLLSRYTHPFGLDYVKVEAISLATGLHGTGSDPPPTPQRAALLDKMGQEEVPNPNEVLESDDTALVLLRGFLPPGIQAGDRFDIEVQTPSRSTTSSLRNGWVLSTRMTELAVLGGQVKSGHVIAACEGPVLVDPSTTGEEGDGYAVRGRILGGGVATKTRPLGLVVTHEHRSPRLSQAIENEVNLRFHHYDSGRKIGVATAKTDEYIELQVHERYRDNIGRFVRVVRSLALGESAAERQQRIARLETQLADPLTAARASLRLEAIGDDQAVDVLIDGSESSDAEVRFYAAEALAYLDKTEAVGPLAEAIRNEPAFRANALAALSTMDDVLAYDALRELLGAKSVETRYGAFRALWTMSSGDPLVQGERLGDQFSYHVLDVGGPDVVHVTRTFRPEIVLFGADQRIKLPTVLDAGSQILVNGLHGDQVTVSRFVVGEQDQTRVVSTRIDDVVRAIVELGGTYPDVVQALQQARDDGALPSRLAVDALPQSGRRYDRAADEEVDPEDAGAAPYRLATPLPDLFSRKK
ncbi:MAG: flagellar basal body P-ring protein FlgI [Planctomycetota bacterium]